MASLNLLADLDAERINGGSGSWGNGMYGSRHKSRPSYSSTSYKSAKSSVIQGNLANNLAIGIGFHGLGMANATSVQENVAIVTTVAG